jgi:hypothetical protein
MQTREKLAHRVQSHAALEAEGIEGGDDEARQPSAAVFGFPEPGFRVAITALYGLLRRFLKKNILNQDAEAG